MALERSVVPRVYLASPDLVADSLYAALEAAGHSPVRALQRIRSDIATPEEARLLAISPGASLLDVERRCFLADGAAGRILPQPLSRRHLRLHGGLQTPVR